jgi:hypothetical protein
MGRRIVTGDRAAVAHGSGVPAPPADGYLSRLAKYIPAEVVGLYLFVTGVIPQNAGEAAAQWVVFAACCVLTVVYMWYVTRREGGKPLWLQVVLATVAFPIWVFAIGGPFKMLAWYQPWIASVVLAFATVVFGMVKPAPGS